MTHKPPRSRAIWEKSALNPSYFFLKTIETTQHVLTDVFVFPPIDCFSRLRRRGVETFFVGITMAIKQFSLYSSYDEAAIFFLKLSFSLAYYLEDLL
jgi:hypothetical protein